MSAQLDLMAGGDLPPAFEVTVYGSPRPAGSKKAFSWKAKDGRSGVSVSDDNPNSKPWKKQVAQVCGEAMEGRKMFPKIPLQATFRFVRLRPSSQVTTKGKLTRSAPDYPITKPDVLKLARAIEDAMSKVVYIDDAHIVREVIEKDFGEPERVEIRIEAMPPRPR